jgi:LPS-assembly protein
MTICFREAARLLSGKFSFFAKWRCRLKTPSWCLARLCLLCAFFSALACAQQTPNPVERQVENPITDNPNVNPLSEMQTVAPRRRTDMGGILPGDKLDVHANRVSVTGKEPSRVYVYEGDVDARIGIYRLQADKVTVYEATNKVIAEGSVVFDQGQQRITGTRAEWNYQTKLGYFENSTGYTNQTNDGTVIYFTADRVERVALDKILVINAEITACEDNVPKWSFRARRAIIKQNDRVRLYNPNLRVKGVPVIYLPYASISIEKRDRQSGFLTPTFSGSGSKGFRITEGYYQTLGRSADITFRGDIYTERGIGFGAAFRARPNSRSFFDVGFFLVKDRILGPKKDAAHPDQGGSTFYANGVQYFSNGFTAAAEVSITSNLAFRQVFSDTIQQVIAPQERSQVYVNRNFGDYSFNVLARNEVTSLPTTRIRIREMPSVTFDKRPSLLTKLFEKLPVYFSFQSGIEGVSRKETAEDINSFRQALGNPNANPLITPSIVQRLDAFPTVEAPFTLGGWSFTATAAARVTYYSNSIKPQDRSLSTSSLVRAYGQFEFDARPPALAKDFSDREGKFHFRHVIEPYVTYRLITGIDDFDRIIRFDYVDTIADTNEFEFGVTNRFFTRRSTVNVSGKPKTKETPKIAVAANAAPTKKEDAEETKTEKKDAAKGAEKNEKNSDQKAATNAAPISDKSASPQTSPNSLVTQPYEILSVTLRAKYFFDPTFGGALAPGERNQFYPINTFSGFTYGGVPRRFSPLNIITRLHLRSDVYTDTRFDVDTEMGALRDLATSFGINKRIRVPVQIFQTFYYTRAISLAPSLAQYADARGKEAGTLQGSQLSPSIFIGNRERGFFGGASFFFDFQNRPNKTTSLVSSTITAGYAFNCCAVTIQNYTFNVGLRRENRVVFSFRLNGIGTFGTEHLGQTF